ncbi:MAG: biopolymer transporter ExbD [Deltaproteobacteria bacterium]|nr:biopolymer transporter ExbD [Deltaproteobacteria bacterium]
MANESSRPPRDSLAPPVAEKPASMSYVNRIVRAKLRRRPEPEHFGLNIYPMMDMLTILLVYMMALFATSSAAAIQQSSELRIPYSTSQVEMSEALGLQISRSGVAVDGKPVLELRNGIVDPSLKQGGSSGFLITPLYKTLSDIRDRKKRTAQKFANQPFVGNVQIIADKRTPYRTLSEVIYTLGQTEFKNLRFVVNKKTK